LSKVDSTKFRRLNDVKQKSLDEITVDEMTVGEMTFTIWPCYPWFTWKSF